VWGGVDDRRRRGRWRDGLYGVLRGPIQCCIDDGMRTVCSRALPKQQ
jgi:hypothetical protein